MRFLPSIIRVLSPSLRTLSLVCAASLALSSIGTAQAASSTSTQGKSAMSTTPHVKLQTNHGDLLIELDAEKAPKTVENFLTYVKEGFFDGTVFHRVINNFMVQGGGFEAGMKQKQVVEKEDPARPVG